MECCALCRGTCDGPWRCRALQVGVIVDDGIHPVPPMDARAALADPARGDAAVAWYGSGILDYSCTPGWSRVQVRQLPPSPAPARLPTGLAVTPPCSSSRGLAGTPSFLSIDCAA